MFLFHYYFQGIYVASVTKSGCLSVHDFEALYCTIHGPSSSSAECKLIPAHFVVLIILFSNGLTLLPHGSTWHEVLIIFYVVGTGKPLVHIPTSMPLNAIRWNPSNQDEVYHLCQCQYLIE